MPQKRSLEFEEFLELLDKSPFDGDVNFLGGNETNKPGLYNVPELIPGPSVYDLAVRNGYNGTEQQFLISLRGSSAYEIALEAGFVGTKAQFINSLKGKSAYQLAVDEGFVGDFQAFLDSLVGKSNYDLAVDEGFVGTLSEYLDTLKGEDGDPGPRGYNYGVALEYIVNIQNSEPGAGRIKFNATIPNQITAVIISHADIDGNNIASWVNSIGNVANLSSRGILHLQNLVGIGGYAEFAVTGAKVVSPTYTRIPVTYISGSLPADTASLAVAFNPAGEYATVAGSLNDTHFDPNRVGDVRTVLDVDYKDEVNSKIDTAITDERVLVDAKFEEVSGDLVDLKQELLTIDEIVLTTDANITAAHNLHTIICNSVTDEMTLVLGEPSALGDNWNVIISNIKEESVVTLLGDFDTGELSLKLKFKQSMHIRCNGTILRPLLRGGGGGDPVVPMQLSLLGDGGNTYTLPVIPTNKEACIVFRGGSIQELDKFDVNLDQLIFDTNVDVGDPIIVYLTTGAIENVLVNPMYAKHQGTGTVGPFTLLRAPTTPNSLDISIRGIGQPRDGSAYVTVGNQITFAEPILNDWYWEEKHIPPAAIPVGIPDPESVGAVHINSAQTTLIREKIDAQPRNIILDALIADQPTIESLVNDQPTIEATIDHAGIASIVAGNGVRDVDLPVRLRAIPPYVSDANAIVETGFYSVSGTWTGSPFAGSNGSNQGYLKHQHWIGSTYAEQTFQSVNGTIVFYWRYKDNGVWTPWKKYTRNNIMISATEPPGMVDGDIWIQT